MQGWVKIHRGVMHHWIFQEKRMFSKFEAWVDLIMMANHQENEFLLGNQLVKVERGSFITSELKLMERWGWSKTKTRNFLKLLEDEKMIVKSSDKQKTTINICNYCIYQASENHEKTTKEPQKNHGETTEEPQKDTNKNVNNDKVTTVDDEAADKIIDLFATIKNINPVNVSSTEFVEVSKLLKQGIPSRIIMQTMNELASKKPKGSINSMRFFIKAIEERWAAEQDFASTGTDHRAPPINNNRNEPKSWSALREVQRELGGEVI